MTHYPIDPQPQLFEDGRWPIHSSDASGKWYRPAGTHLSGVVPYPLFVSPEKGLIHFFCPEHDQWEWINKKETIEDLFTLSFSPEDMTPKLIRKLDDKIFVWNEIIKLTDQELIYLGQGKLNLS